jgi:hypothetical protein
MYGSVEGALAALHEGLDATERAEIRIFLIGATNGNEMQCRAATAINNPIMKANSFIPAQNLSGLSEPCLHFHRLALAAFPACLPLHSDLHLPQI